MSPEINSSRGPFALPHPRSPHPRPELSAQGRAQGASFTQVVGRQVTDPRLPFLHLAAPLVAAARNRLLQGLERLASRSPAHAFEVAALDSGFSLQLARHLLEMLSRVLVLEMRVADREGELGQGSEHQRFERFGERLRRWEVREAILDEYPVLAGQLEFRLEQWVASSLELARRLVEDLPTLRRHFYGGTDPGPVVEVEIGLGDRHREGRSVAFLTFRSGLRLVYKPRPLGVESGFQGLLAWCNRHLRVPLRRLDMLDRGSHGWVEHVAPTACGSRDEVARFFVRQGSYLALLYAIQATDFHFENLIAAGEHPLLVDLESLFHPRLEHDAAPEAADPAARALRGSVITVGLLPLRMFARAGSDGVDVSGLGAREGQLTPQPVPLWEKAGTTAMRLVRRRVPFITRSHRVHLGEEPVEVIEFLDALLRGFEDMYRIVLEHRHELLAKRGPLASFQDTEVRFVARPTRVYALLHQESFHPSLLRGSEDRNRFFDRLRLDLRNRPWLEPLLPFEKEALQRGDIPLFNSRPDSRSLWTADGRELTDFFTASASARVREGLLHLGEEDLALQQRLIRASVATLYPEREGEGTLSSRLPGPPATTDRAGLLQLAVALGDRLAAQALERGEEVGWLGFRHHGARAWSVTPAGLDLFDGLPGIALFLADLGRVSAESRFTVLAERALLTLRRQLGRRGEGMTAIGAFEGWGGVMYLLAHLGASWQRPDLLEEAVTVTQRVAGLIGRDEVFDIVGGAAGCIGALLALHRATPRPEILKTAVTCGDHLLAQATQLDDGALGWVGRIAPRPLTGFSHGAAGIAWALVELGAATGETRFTDAAHRAMAYERSLFVPEADNWRDARREPAEDRESAAGPFPTAWCYGAVGIGLGRLGCWRHLRDEATRAEVETAIRATLAEGFGRDHSLNQGDLGSLDFLLQVQRHPGAAEGFAPSFDLDEVLRAVMSDVAGSGPRCGTPLAAESSGLMIGLAGIGHGLLRLAAPEDVPSVLVLAAPATTRDRGSSPSRASLNP